MKNVIGAVLIVGGMMAMAGSAGDCDGKCMEYANDIGTMLAVAAGGLVAMLMGVALVKDSLFGQ
jgi:hypothetical protein